VKVRAARLALALLVPALSVPAAGRADATEASGERVRVATLLPFVEDALHRVTAPADDRLDADPLPRPPPARRAAGRRGGVGRGLP